MTVEATENSNILACNGAYHQKLRQTSLVYNFYFNQFSIPNLNFDRRKIAYLRVLF